MKTIQKLLTIYFLVLIAASCNGGDDDSVPPPTTGTVSGLIQETGGLSPIEGANVTIGSRTATSTADGSFELSDMPTGNKVIMVEAPGFTAYSESIQVQEGQNIHNIQMEKTDIYEAHLFTMYLPSEVEKIRGVLFILAGAGGDQRPFIRGEQTDPPEAVTWRTMLIGMAETYGLALLGNNSAHYYFDDPSQSTLLALEGFALVTGHAELAQAPLLVIGYSLGAKYTLNFAIKHPERTLGVHLLKGLIYSGFSDDGWAKIRHIPVYIHVDELDTGVRNTIPAEFESNRESGALWAAGIEPGAGHAGVPSLELMGNWMESVIALRIPEEVIPGEIPTLKEIPEESGWLGDLNTFEVMPYAEFNGDAGSASWLPNEETAQDWRSVFEK